MKRRLKYISIEGRVVSKGEYISESMEYRPYEAVTIVDKDGDDVHFTMLSMSKRTDDLLAKNSDAKMYILRLKIKDKLYGVMYAMEIDGEKHFYPETAIPVLKALGLKSRNRYQFMSDGQAASGAVIILGGVIGAALSFGFGFNWIPSFIAGMVFVSSYLYFPMVFSGRNAGLSIMRRTMKDNGFSLSVSSNRKY